MSLSIGVFGAGAIGCFIGGRLAHLGHSVTLVGRPRIIGPIAKSGLELIDLDGKTLQVSPTQLRCVEDPRTLIECDIVIIAVKGNDTLTAAHALESHLRGDAALISLQNGVDNPEILRTVLGEPRVFGGMVSWNVVWHGGESLARMTSGPVMVEKKPSIMGRRAQAMVDALDRDGLPASTQGEFTRVLWSKLLFNVNNAINALLGVTIAAELADRRCRRLISAAMKEGLAVMEAAGIKPVRLGRMSPTLSATVLPLPDALFTPLARRIMKVGDDARSSMYVDLCKNRPTEIDQLNGAIVRLGKLHGVPTPLNERIVDEVRKAERRGAGSPRLTVDALL